MRYLRAWRVWGPPLAAMVGLSCAALSSAPRDEAIASTSSQALTSQTFLVTSIGDGSGSTLRQALTDAIAAGPGPHTIDARSVNGTITLQSPLPSLTSTSVAVLGPGPSQLTIDGANTWRIFTASSTAFSVSGVTLANGRAAGGNGADGLGHGGAGGGGAGLGGCVYASGGTATFANVAFSHCQAQGGAGGSWVRSSPVMNGSGGGGMSGNGASGTTSAVGNGGTGLWDVPPAMASSTDGRGGSGGTSIDSTATGIPGENGAFGGGGGGGGGATADPSPYGSGPAIGGSGGFGGGGGGGGVGNTTVGSAGAAGLFGGTGAGTASANYGGGGAGLGGAVFVRSGSVVFAQCSITGNSSATNGAGGGALSQLAGQGKGGGLFLLSGTARLVDTTIAADTAASTGGTVTSNPQDNNGIYGTAATATLSLAVKGGNGQTGALGQAFGAPLQATTLDGTSAPMPGIPVIFTIISGVGGATASFPNALTTAVALTDAQGVATAPTLTAKNTTGAFTVEASFGTYRATFSLTNICTAGSQCATGFCADTVCCDKACNGSCEACAEPGSAGTCKLVSGAPRSGHSSCAGQGTACAGSCSGQVAACTYPGAMTTCGTATCASGDFQPASTCNGAGTCSKPSTQSCGNYVCKTSGCPSSCTTPSDCKAGFVCLSNACATPPPPPPDAGPDAADDTGGSDAIVDAQTPDAASGHDGSSPSDAAPAPGDDDGGSSPIPSPGLSAPDAASHDAGGTAIVPLPNNGCSCRTAPTTRTPALLAFAPFAFLALRRRSRRA